MTPYCITPSEITHNKREGISYHPIMLQDILYELDAASVAQIATSIGGLVSLFHYFCPKRSATIWGIPTDARSPQVVFWIVERIGFVNFLMAFAFRLIFYYDIHYSDAFGVIFAIWATDYLYSILCVRFIQGSASRITFRKMLLTNFIVVSIAFILHALNSMWGEVVMKFVLQCTLLTGFFQTLVPKFGLYQSGLSSDDRGCNEGLMRIHGGSLMQFATFGVLIMNGFEAKRALCLAMMMQLTQLFFSHYVAYGAYGDERAVGLTKSSFWILCYIPIIMTLWTNGNGQ